MDKQVEFLVRLRDAFIMASEATNEFIDSLAPPETKVGKEQAAAVLELNFTTLKFEPQKGAKLGEYEIAYEQSNRSDKWQSAYNILNKTNATIQDRFYGEGYQHIYWIFGMGRIFRQKLEPRS